MAVWYGGSTKYSAVTAWAASTAYTAGQIVRQLATPAENSERCFVCVVAGTSGGSEPTWTTTVGAKTTDNTVTWQECTGKAGVNGDATNTTAWAASVARALGDIIKDSGGTRLFICTTAGTSKSSPEPTWNTTAGSTTTDGTAVFTCLGLASSFGAYAAPFARLAMATQTGKFAASTDTTYFSNNHAESWSGALPASSTGVGSVICVDDAVVPPTTLAYTGSVTTSGANGMSLASGFVSGFVFNIGSGANSASFTAGGSAGARLRRCKINLLGTSGGNLNTSGGTGGDTELGDCDITFNSTASSIAFQAYTTQIAGGTICATGTVPTNLMNITGAVARVRDVDLSNVSTTLVSASANPAGLIVMENCKRHATVAKMTQPTTGLNSTTLKMYNCDSGATNYRFYHNSYAAIVQEETSIVRTGGATDGTTPVSLNIASSANCLPRAPYTSEEITRWNDSTGSSLNATIELTTDATLTSADCWLSIEYLGSSSSPLGSSASSRAVVGASALTASSATWGGTAKANKYKITVPFTPQMKGPIKARVHLAKPSTTIYVDPVLTVA